MVINKSSIPGCYELIPEPFTDERGFLVKTFHSDLFAEHGLQTGFKEQYYSFSRQGVLRGLHFQVPPKDHAKLVYCITGQVMDAVVDLRAGSPTYGKFEIFELRADKHTGVYVPNGLAHGFYVLSETAVIVNTATAVYSPEHDGGIHWRSLPIPWPDESPIISCKDSRLIDFAQFRSPFVYKAEEVKGMA